MDLYPAIARWVHFMAGIMWIGLLYYFNFVQVDALKAAAADNTGAGITKHVAPRALAYFRWSSVVTWLAGAACWKRRSAWHPKAADIVGRSWITVPGGGDWLLVLRRPTVLGAIAAGVAAFWFFFRKKRWL